MDNNVNPQIGELLKQQRLERGWSLRDLEKASGIDNAAIYRIEQGKTKDPSLEKLRAMATALELSLAALLMEASDIDIPPLSEYLRVKFKDLSEPLLEQLDHQIHHLVYGAEPITGEET